VTTSGKNGTCTRKPPSSIGSRMIVYVRVRCNVALLW
jgi:hypothetical protein